VLEELIRHFGEVFGRFDRHLLLISEVVEKRAFGDSGSSTYFVDSGCGVSLFSDCIHGGVEDSVARFAAIARGHADIIPTGWYGVNPDLKKRQKIMDRRL